MERKRAQWFFHEGKLPSFNEIIRARGKKGKQYGKKRYDFYNEMKKEHEEAIFSSIRKYQVAPVRKSKVFIVFSWCELNKKRDLDNIAAAKKFILDAMVTAGIIEDDSPKFISGWIDQFNYTYGKAGVRVEIGYVEEVSDVHSGSKRHKGVLTH